MDSPVGQVEFRLLLDRLAKGDDAARQDLAVALYPYLVRAAYNVMRHERKEHTLQPTALAHETIIRLLQQGSLAVESDQHLWNTAILIMQRQLIEHARRRNARRRSGKLARVELSASDLAVTAGDAEWLVELKRQMRALADENAESAQVLQSTYMEGMTLSETSASSGLTVAQVRHRLAAGFKYLQRKMGHKP